MWDLRPVGFIIGLLLLILAVAMLVPAASDLSRGDADWGNFIGAAAVTLFFGGALALTCRGRWPTFGLRQGFLIANLAWIVASLFAALPFVFSGRLGFTDAFFEAASGLTTTGMTVIAGLDHAAPGILLWRAILNWLGGIGFVVMAVTVLPVLQVGGMQLFRVEAFDRQGLAPRAAELGVGLALLYTGLTALAALVLWLAGMEGFDAVAHALSGISTGGFSTKDAGIAAFNSPAIEWALVGVMIFSALPFLLLLRASQGRPQVLITDSQVQWFFGLGAAASLVLTFWLIGMGEEVSLALRSAVFNVASFMTGTGFLSADPGQWGGFPVALLLVLMFIGGCAGSTTTGVKMFRIQIFFSLALQQLRRSTRPHGVFLVAFNRRPVPDDVTDSVLAFFFLLSASFAIFAMGLGLMGLDFTAAMTAAASAIANVGPGFEVGSGQAASWIELPAIAKWWLAAAMLLGRLEFFTLAVLLTRGFWRK